MARRTKGSASTLRGLAILGLFAACGSGTISYAVSVREWSASTAEEFARGTLDGVAIDERGRLGLAPQIESIFGPDEGIVWDVAPAGHDAAFVALSGPGRLLRVSRGGTAEVWYEAGADALITAVAADGRGGVFAGSSPDGRILHLSGPGEVTATAQTGATFVWALEADRGDGVWIGTGVPGGVRRWVPGGEVQSVFDAGDDPVRSLLVLAPKTVVAGTGGRGRVIRLDDQGSAFVLYDAEEKEVVDLAVNDAGIVFALTAGGAVQPPRAAIDVPRTPDNSVSVTATAPPAEPSPTPGAPAEKKDEPPKPTTGAGLTAPLGGALYRIDPDGDARKIWSTSTEIPFAVVSAPEGRLLVSTGDKGRVYQLDADGRSSRLLRIASNQGSAMAVGAEGEIIVGGSSDARVALLGPDVAATGEYLSAAIDAGTVADWGRVRWEAHVPQGSAIAAAVRVGNTEEADETWTKWIPLAGGAAEVDTEAPPARWMQIRLTLSRRRDALPTVSKLDVFFTPRNRPPLIQNITVGPIGVVWVKGPENSMGLQGPFVADDPVARRAASSLRRPGQGTVPLRRLYEQGTRTFSWQGSDPDDDRLTYLVELRRDEATHWFPLASRLEDEFLSWDARSMPDGLYRIRVTGEDQRDNPTGKALSHTGTSEAFRIDNTRPLVDGLRVIRDGASVDVEFIASDPHGRISSVEIALDGGAWEPLEPIDGVADSEQERYRARIETGSDAGPGRYLRVRVADAAGNLGGDAWLIEP